MVVRPRGTALSGPPVQVPLSGEAPEADEVQTRGQVRRARRVLAAGLVAAVGAVGVVMGVHASTERRLEAYAQEYRDAATAAAASGRSLWRAGFVAQIALHDAPAAATTETGRDLATDIADSAELLDRIDGTRRVLAFETFAEAEAAIDAVEDLAARAADAATSIGTRTKEIAEPGT